MICITCAAGAAQADDTGKTLSTQPFQLKDKVYNLRYEKAVGSNIGLIVGTEVVDTPGLTYVCGSVGLRSYLSDGHRGFYLGCSLSGVYANVVAYPSVGPVSAVWAEAEAGYKWQLPFSMTADMGFAASLDDQSATEFRFELGYRW